MERALEHLKSVLSFLLVAAVMLGILIAMNWVQGYGWDGGLLADPHTSQAAIGRAWATPVAVP